MSFLSFVGALVLFEGLAFGMVCFTGSLFINSGASEENAYLSAYPLVLGLLILIITIGLFSFQSIPEEFGYTKINTEENSLNDRMY